MSLLNDASAESPALQVITAETAAAERTAQARKEAILVECVRLQRCAFGMGCAD